ncbi:MAG: hypothetical protein ACI8P9_001635 [Parasphingorhabdus sp.]|jgi:hypothetical protein
MADNQLVSKVDLFKQIQQVISSGETGFITILTDTRRSVLLQFSAGRLTHTNARSKDVADAIQVLNECDQVKFSYVAAPVENRPEVMPAESFLQLIDPGGDAGAGNFQAPSPIPTADFFMPEVGIPSAAPVVTAGNSVDNSIASALTTLAIDYIGPIADLVVSEALSASPDVLGAINVIPSNILDADQAAEFRNAALATVPNF